MTIHPAYVIQKDSFGQAIEFKIVDTDGSALDISAATTLAVDLRKPDGTAVTKTGALVSGGVDGLMKYTWVADDLNLTGVWTALPRAEKGAPGAYKYRGALREFLVRAGA